MDNSTYNPKKTIIIALVLFVIDAFLINMGAIAIILIYSIVFWRLPKSVILKLKKQSPKIQIIKSLIYSVTAFCIIGANIINNKIADNRAEKLIHNIEQYHIANSKYPAKLADLVPVYIPKIPIAKYTLTFNEFIYYNTNENAMLSYVSLPPFSRPAYVFNNKSWFYYD